MMRLSTATVLIPMGIVFALIPAGEANSKSFFCKPEPIKLGSYRPSDGQVDLDILVRFPNASPFWFDDDTGDYASFDHAAAIRIEPAKIRVPLTLSFSSADKLSNLAAVSVASGQCVEAEIGLLPAPGSR